MPSDNPALAALRDIHAAPAAPWWPPAPGWWLLAALVLLLLFWLARAALKAIRRRRLRRSVLRELDALQNQWQQGGSARALASGLNVLLKRVALVRFGRPAVSKLSGEQWQAFLHDRSPGKVEAALDWLENAYRNGASDAGDETDPSQLILWVRHWITAYV